MSCMPGEHSYNWTTLSNRSPLGSSNPISRLELGSCYSSFVFPGLFCQCDISLVGFFFKWKSPVCNSANYQTHVLAHCIHKKADQNIKKALHRIQNSFGVLFIDDSSYFMYSWRRTCKLYNADQQTKAGINYLYEHWRHYRGDDAFIHWRNFPVSVWRHCPVINPSL